MAENKKDRKPGWFHRGNILDFQFKNKTKENKPEENKEVEKNSTEEFLDGLRRKLGK